MPKVDITTQKPTTQSAWNDGVKHPLQTWEWGEFRKAMGIDVVRISWRRPEPAGGQLTFHRIPYTPWTIGYFPKGPAPTTNMLIELTKLGQDKNAIFIQLEPNVICSPSRSQSPPGRWPKDSFKVAPSHRPLFTKYTFILDLTKPEEELLTSMHSKTRYNLRVAQKHNVTVREDNSDSAFEEYLRLTEETTGRQGFYAHNTLYHKTMWAIMRKAGIAHLFTAQYQGVTLAAWIIFAWNKTLYYPYGASSRLHRDVMAPTLILWEIAKWGKAHGYESFDLWGALGPNPDPHNPWFGFHRFKQGFNPLLVEYTGSYDLVIRPFLYKLYTIADTVRWTILKRKVRMS